MTDEVNPSEIERVVDAVVLAISLETIELPEEFFPAQLSAALIDAVFRTDNLDRRQSAPAAEHYCRRFGLSRTRDDRWNPPPAIAQETLGELVRRCDELGPDAMTNDVFEARGHFPGHQVSPGTIVAHAAGALRDIGVEVLQDIAARPPGDIDDALRRVPGVDGHTIRRLLMYTGGDDFVLGDVHVRRFVERALGRSNVSAGSAERLVRGAAYELILSPRFLDREIWLHALSG